MGDTLLLLVQTTAILCCAVFTGAAIYISLVEHPARMECGTELALREFAPSYRRAAVMQASLAVLGTVASLVAWGAGAGATWLVAGLLLGFVVPFTLMALLPTNHRLLDPALDRASDEALRLLSRWGRLHAVRSVASLAALSVLATALAAR
jgi:uncharacterized membrane protein